MPIRNNKKLTSKTGKTVIPENVEPGICPGIAADPQLAAVLSPAASITKKKAAVLKETELSDHEALLDYTDDMLWSVSSDFKLIAANKVFIKSLENYTGLIFKPGDSLLMKQVFPDDLLTTWESYYRKALLGRSYCHEIYIPGHNNWKESWTDTSFNPIRKAGEIVGIACHSRNITERKITEEKLRQSEARLILAQDVAKIGSWETDLLNWHVIWSEETYRIFEIDPDMYREVSHPGFLAFVHPKDQAEVEAAFVKSFDDEGDSINTIEHRIITKNGNIKILEEHWKIIRDNNGHPIKAVGTCQDISERKKADRALQAAYNEKNIILESIADAFFAVDKNWVITYWNKEAEKMLQTPKKQILGRNLWEVFSTSIDSVSYKKYHQAINTRRLINFEDHYPALDKWYEITAYPSITGLSVYFKDITERKRSEAALQKAYEEKNTVLESIDDGFFALDTNSVVTYWNKKAELLLDTKKEDLIGKNLHEVFIARGSRIFYDNYVKALKEKITIRFEGFSNLSQKWFAVSAFGSDNGLSIYFKDVTNQKNAEEKIKESELRYRSLIEQATDTICILDASGKFIEMNPSGCLMFGYSREEILQLFMGDVLFEEDIKKDPIRIDELKAGKTTSNERRIKRKDGTIVYVELSAKMIEDGRIIVFGRDISERKESERLINESEAKYRSFFESSMDGILLTVTDGAILSANPAACEIFKMTEEEICAAGRFGVVDLSDPRVYALIEQRRQTGRAKGELTLLRKDGSKFEAELTSAIFTDSYSRERTSMIVRDITERKESEKELATASHGLQQALNELNKIMDSSLDIICTVNAAGYFIKVSAASEAVWGYKPAELIGKAIMDFVCPEDREKTNKTADKVLAGIHATLFENRYIHKNGSLVPMEWSARWDEKEQLRYGIARDMTEKKRLEKANEIERQRFLGLYLQAPSCMGIIKGPNYVYEMANPLYLQLIGKSDIIGKTVKEVLPELENQGIFEFLDTVYKTGNTFSANEMLVQFDIKGNGELVDTYLNFIYQAHRSHDGSIDGIVFFANDVTEQVLSRRKIEESGKRYRQIVETAQEGIWMIDENSRTTFVNKKMCEILEYTEEEMMGRDIYAFMDEEGQQLAVGLMLKKMQGHIDQDHFKYISKSGKEIWTNLSANPLFNEAGIYTGSLAMVTDITEKKQAELQIKESNERYNLISKATNDMVWDWDLVTGKVYRNKEGWKKIFRTGEKEIENETTNEWDERIHPDDREKVIYVYGEIQKSEKDFFEVECRILRDDGTYAYVHDRGNIIRNEQGEAVRLIGATQDITERKEAALQVAKSELRFRSLVQNSSDLVSILDEKAYYLYSSPAIKKILGYEPDFMVGKNAFSFIHPDDIVTIKADLAKEKTGKDFDVPPFRFRNEKGEWIWLESKVTIMTDNPEVGGYVFNSRDITERKVAEAEIEKLSFIARETNNAVVITNPHGEIVWINEAFTRITGFELEEANGKKPGDILQGDETNLAAVRFMRNKLKQAEPFECDILNYSKSGRKFWLRIQCQPQFDETGKLKHFFAIQTDITNEKEVEEILKASEERYRYLFNNNPASIFIWDINNFNILEVNDTAIRVYGYHREEFLSKTALELSLPKDSNKIKHFASIARQKSEFRSEVTYTHVNSSGEEMYMSISSHLIQFKGQSVILALATNITDKIFLEIELEHERQAKQQEITDAVISAQEKERLELGSELHDNINQILAGSRLYLGLAKKELKIEYPYLEETDTLIRSAITEIRNLSHSLIPPSLNESELIEALNNIIESTHKSSGIIITLKALGFDETHVPDKLKLAIYRIVQEQFHNILKYAGAQQVIISLVQDKEKTVLSIKDDGVGFDVAKKANGVGLMNIKTRASLFNGDLTVISSPGNGCELRVLFN